MDLWLLHCIFSQQCRQPSDHGCVGRANCFPVFGSQSVIVCDLSGKSSVFTLMRQWNGCPSNRSKLAHVRIFTCTITSPAPKFTTRFLSTPKVVSMLVFADDMFIIWSEWIGNPSSSQIHLGIARFLTQNPECLEPSAWSHQSWLRLLEAADCGEQQWDHRHSNAPCCQSRGWHSKGQGPTAHVPGQSWRMC